VCVRGGGYLVLCSWHINMTSDFWTVNCYCFITLDVLCRWGLYRSNILLSCHNSFWWSSTRNKISYRL